MLNMKNLCKTFQLIQQKINFLISDGVYNNYIKQIFKKFPKNQKYININMSERWSYWK